MNDPPAHPGLRRVQTLARILDSSLHLPGTSIRIGLDPVIGLIPGIGDLLGAVFSGYIILEAARAGVPAFTLARMLANVGVDTLTGAVPLAGDAFDAAWKSNIRNADLFERCLNGNTLVARRGKFAGLIILVVLAVLVIGAAGAAAAVLLYRFLSRTV